MGFYDFVAGIVLGIILACLIFVVQTSRVSAIRATYSGTVVESTVRRHPVHRRFLNQIGGQIKVAKLAGYLFFGSIVAVEKQIRNLIQEEAFSKQPIRYLILDFRHVTGLDFSAAEAFVRMNRVLGSRDVEMVLSGVSVDGEVGQSLAMVGLLETEDHEPPKIFEDLNQALESCENELLIAFKQRSDMLAKQRETSNLPPSMTIPQQPTSISAADAAFNSPRSNQVARAATTALSEHTPTAFSKAQTYPQPLPLILQAFKDVTSRDADFWRRAAPYFRRVTFSAGAVLHGSGASAGDDGLYLLEEGVLRAEHDLEQGRYSESMVAGTTCGELPFFAETAAARRTATVVAEDESVAWLLDRASWRRMEAEAPEVAMEMLRVGMKLTSERMNSITS
jgi:SulP family sulfate permease